MSPIPDRIAEATVGHAVDLTRVEAGLRLKVRALLDKLGKGLVADVLDAELDTTRTAWQRARLADLLKAAEQRIIGTYGLIAEQQAADLAGLVEISTAGLRAAINEAIGANLLQPIAWTDEQLASIASDALVEGAPSAEWWKRQAQDLTRAFSDEMRHGMVQGDTIAQLRDRIMGKDIPGVNAMGKVDLRKVRDLGQRGLIKRARRNAESLVRTSVITTANHAHLAFYGANSDVLDAIQWISTLDGKTTPVCRALDGLRWSLPDYEPIGHDKAFPGPTAHWACRSTQVPVTKSWKDLLGIDGLDDIPEGERASMGGPVSAKLTYEDWLKSQPESRQLQVLGPGRLALWKQGKLSFGDMIDQTGNPLTLAQMRKSR